jgi:CheY-like chemotaxis protein
MAGVQTSRVPLDVLIAEDDCDTRQAVRLLLEEEGYTCAEAEDGRVAVETAHAVLPRVVLMDLMMPDVDGFTAARQLRSDPRTRDVRIHCLTALNFPAARRAAEEAGCDGFLTKPFTVEELLEAVSNAVYALREGDEMLIRGIERLHKTLAAEVPGRESKWCKQLSGALNNVEDALRRKAAQWQGDDGSLAGMDVTRPTLARRIAWFCREHNGLLEQTRILRAQVQGAAQAFNPAPKAGETPSGLPELGPRYCVVDFSYLRRGGQHLVTALRRHAQEERSVLFESVNTDIGVGD